MGQRLLVWIRRRPHLLPSVAAAVMLLVALGRWPYSFFTLLRVVVCAAAVFVLVQSIKGRRTWGAWAFGIVAVLFNPLLPIHLARDVWRVLDVLAAVAFMIGGVAVCQSDSAGQEARDTQEKP